MKLPDAGIPNENGHEWALFDHHVVCRVCGIVRRADGKNKPCPKVMPKIVFK